MSGNLTPQQRSAFITSPKRLIPILIIFLFVILTAWAMREHLRSNGEATLSDTQRIEFKQWATTPLKLPEESLTPPPLPTAEFLEQHTLLVDDFLQLYNSIALEPPANTNPCTALDKWDCLTSEDNAKLLREVPPLMKRAKTLTESPFYSVLPHLRFATNRKMSGDDCEKIAAFNFVLSAYTKLQVIQGNNTEAIDTWDILLAMLHRDPYIPQMESQYISFEVSSAFYTGEFIRKRNENTSVTQRLAELVTKHKPHLVQENNEAFILGENIQQVVRMKADNFMDELSLTPRDLVEQHLQGYPYRFQNWLAQNLPPEDPRIKTGALKTIAATPKIKKHDSALTFMNKALKFVIGNVDHPSVVQSWKNVQKSNELNLMAINEINEFESRLQ